MVGIDDYERLHIETRDEWRAWLANHHGTAPGVWLVSWKKPTGKPAVGYDAAVEEALCFGWIDSTVHSLDDERGEQLFTPRRPRSGWSASNKERVERLDAAGLLKPAGLAAIETAKANGSWTKLDRAAALTMPDDLAAALAARAGAAQGWEAFPPFVRRGSLAWIDDAKRPDTRERRVAEIVAAAAEGRRPKPFL